MIWIDHINGHYRLTLGDAIEQLPRLRARRRPRRLAARRRDLRRHDRALLHQRRPRREPDLHRQRRRHQHLAHRRVRRVPDRLLRRRDRQRADLRPRAAPPPRSTRTCRRRNPADIYPPTRRSRRRPAPAAPESRAAPSSRRRSASRWIRLDQRDEVRPADGGDAGAGDRLLRRGDADRDADAERRPRLQQDLLGDPRRRHRRHLRPRREPVAPDEHLVVHDAAAAAADSRRRLERESVQHLCARCCSKRGPRRVRDARRLAALGSGSRRLRRRRARRHAALRRAGDGADELGARLAATSSRCTRTSSSPACSGSRTPARRLRTPISRWTRPRSRAPGSSARRCSSTAPPTGTRSPARAPSRRSTRMPARRRRTRP